MTPQNNKNRKALLVFPLLIIPFLLFAFWALGGGQGNADQNANEATNGLLTDLPDAKLDKKKEADKWGLYELAARDSLRLKGEEKKDPFNSMTPESDLVFIDTAADLKASDDTRSPYTVRSQKHSTGNHVSGYNYSTKNNQADENEARLKKKLAELEKAVNQPQETEAVPNSKREDLSLDYDKETDRLQQMMEAMQQEAAVTGSGDPAMDQMDGMLDKILDIQDPTRLQERQRQLSITHTKQAYIVTAASKEDKISLLSKDKKHLMSKSNGFFSLESGNTVTDTTANTIEAVVHESQTIVTGSIVKLRLGTNIYVSGTLIPAGTLVHGQASLSGERLAIKLSNIRYGPHIYPIELSVYDLDGLDGIHIPGAITREVAKQSANETVQSLGINSISNSLSVQAASAGIETIKSLASRKAKLVKVKVKAGYKVLLRNKEN